MAELSGIYEQAIGYKYHGHCEYIRNDESKDVGGIDGMNSNGPAASDTYTMENDDGNYLETCQEQKKAFSDDAVREEMKAYGCSGIKEFGELARDEQVRYIRLMHNRGAGISRLCRVTGISRMTIYKMLG